ncbi:DUF4089 domain-containing protein [Uliginosibacterium sp. H1]|uniref:DUF4089 domain-containing protein n=1 Tax=Uliginosibacterium sp. H1 TaxID=3114757 RepID=UPI002E17F910|nr:DUF4089 domain-containing protein [Uliginosibacterium sp. H1]
MTSLPDDFDWAAYVRQTAALQGYALDAEQVGRVAQQLVLIARNAAPLMAADLSDRIEPASVYRA